MTLTLRDVYRGMTKVQQEVLHYTIGTVLLNYSLDVIDLTVFNVSPWTGVQREAAYKLIAQAMKLPLSRFNALAKKQRIVMVGGKKL